MNIYQILIKVLILTQIKLGFAIMSDIKRPSFVWYKKMCLFSQQA